LTVEDPAEAFEDLRDKNDIQMLQNHDQFIREAYGSPQFVGGRVGGVGRARKSGHGNMTQSKGKLIPPADKTWIEKWRKDLKIAGVSPCRHGSITCILSDPKASIPAFN